MRLLKTEFVLLLLLSQWAIAAPNSNDPFGVAQSLGLNSPSSYGGYAPPASMSQPPAGTPSATPAQAMPSATKTAQPGIPSPANIAPTAPVVSDASTPATIITPVSPQPETVANALSSNVFGANLFTGAFAHVGPTQFNPDYAIAIGDQIQVRFGERSIMTRRSQSIRKAIYFCRMSVLYRLVVFGIRICR